MTHRRGKNKEADEYAEMDMLVGQTNPSGYTIHQGHGMFSWRTGMMSKEVVTYLGCMGMRGTKQQKLGGGTSLPDTMKPPFVKVKGAI